MKTSSPNTNTRLAYFIIVITLVTVSVWVTLNLYSTASYFFYTKYTPTVCTALLKQSNILPKPVQVGSSWSDGSAIYFIPQELYFENGGYLMEPSMYVDTSRCQQQLNIKGALVYRKQGIDTTIPSSILTIELKATESSQGEKPFAITDALQGVFTSYAPEEKSTQVKAMRFSKIINEENSNLSYIHGTGIIREINGVPLTGTTIDISQENGVWNVVDASK